MKTTTKAQRRDGKKILKFTRHMDRLAKDSGTPSIYLAHQPGIAEMARRYHDPVAKEEMDEWHAACRSNRQKHIDAYKSRWELVTEDPDLHARLLEKNAEIGTPALVNHVHSLGIRPNGWPDRNPGIAIVWAPGEYTGDGTLVWAPESEETI
jgi:hypothetical protein